MKFLQDLMNCVCLRRTKDTKIKGEPILQLPKRTIRTLTLTFSDEERQQYDLLEAESKSVFEKFNAEGTLMKNYGVILKVYVSVIFVFIYWSCSDISFYLCISVFAP